MVFCLSAMTSIARPALGTVSWRAMTSKMEKVHSRAIYSTVASITAMHNYNREAGVQVEATKVDQSPEGEWRALLRMDLASHLNQQSASGA